MKYYRPKERTEGLDLGLMNALEHVWQSQVEMVYTRGYEDGMQDANVNSKEAYQKGYDEAIKKAYLQGYNQGFDAEFQTNATVRLAEFKKRLANGLLKVGDELVTTDIDGEAIFVVAHLKDGKAYMVRKYLLEGERPLISNEFNAFEWLNNEYRESLPIKLTEMIEGDVTLPSEKEVFGKNEYGEDEQGTERLEWFKKVLNRVSARSADSEYTDWWWTRTKREDASYFAYVDADGSPTYATPSYPYVGLRPHFILKI